MVMSAEAMVGCVLQNAKESGMVGNNNGEKENTFAEEMKKMFIGKEIEEQMFARRWIYLWDEVNDMTAKAVVQRILFFDAVEKKDITILINSPGGSISSGLAIYDAMSYARSDIATVCMGQAASMGAVLLCAGTKGKRYAWSNARVMIHQPLIAGNFYAPASDIKIQAEEMLRIREKLNEILSNQTGKPLNVIEVDTDRDFFMSAEEAKNYGLIDHVKKGF
ncbi:MAG: ATP-dependent Clp protease proteolytic subunit [Chitinivibrionales bacterium]|nr:ATP-dependent Clp protease proteolytic subunit [Chitinivibrionales bacterium]